jgi:hypothetical protein
MVTKKTIYYIMLQPEAKLNIGYLFNKKRGDKHLLKKDITDAVKQGWVKTLGKSYKRYHRELKQVGWSLNEYIQAVFPKIYTFTLDEIIDAKQDAQKQIMETLIDNKIKIDSKQLKKVNRILDNNKDKYHKDIQKMLNNKDILKTNYIKLTEPGYPSRKVKQGMSVVMFARDLAGNLFLDTNGYNVPTVGVLTKVLSSKKAEVKDSFGNTYFTNNVELRPTLIDIFGHQYYSDMTMKAQNMIANPQLAYRSTQNSVTIGSGQYKTAVAEGDHVVVRLRRRDSTLIYHNQNYVPVVAKITAIYSPNDITIIDAIGNVHHNISKNEMTPILLDVNGQQFYSDMTQRALNIYRRYP